MQRQVSALLEASCLRCGPEKRYIDLVSEVGELGKELLLETAYGRQPRRPSPGTAQEMGDCLFALLALCEELGIDAQAALTGALEKYRGRMARTGQVGSGGASPTQGGGHDGN